MRKTGCRIHYHHEVIISPNQCAFCGTDGGRSFQNAIVCEECLNYIKSIK